MISIDWSHTKGLTTYDGKKVRVVERATLLKSKSSLKSIGVIIEQGCPLSLLYGLLRAGYQVSLIDQFKVKEYREAKGLEKSDANDAMAIYGLAQSQPNLLSPVSLDDSQIQLIDLYQRYKRYQKARVAMVNMQKAYVRQFGEGESRMEIEPMLLFNPSPAVEGEAKSILNVKSINSLNPSPSSGTLPYDIAIDTLKVAETSCLKELVKLTPPIPDTLKIKGLGSRLWAGIYVTANPANFPNSSSYLRYCGLVNLNQLNHKYNRHAKMLYHLLAEEVMQQRDSKFRPVYDKCKADIANKHPDYTKLHIHNAALNRTATFIAKEVFKVLKLSNLQLQPATGQGVIRKADSSGLSQGG